MENELLEVKDMKGAKEFAEVLKAVALEYDLEKGGLPESEYEGYSILTFFTEKYLKKSLGFGEYEWREELFKIATERKVKKK